MNFKKGIIIISALAFIFPSFALADYTDYVPGVGVITVSWAGNDSSGNPQFNVTTPSGGSYSVSGTVGDNGRGVPDAGQLAAASGGSIGNIVPPQREGTAGVIDSTQAREEQFRADYPNETSTGIIIGYPDANFSNLAPDNATSEREVATIIDRALGKDADGTAWDSNSGKDMTKDMTFSEVNDMFADAGVGYRAVDSNGDGIVQRGELFNLPSGYPGGYPPGVVPPGDEPIIPPPDYPPVTPPSSIPSCSFNSSREKIILNQGADISWSCPNAFSCTLTPGYGSVGIIGTKTVSPKVTTEYTLTCSNGAGSNSFKTTVNVFEVFIEEVGPGN